MDLARQGVVKAPHLQTSSFFVQIRIPNTLKSVLMSNLYIHTVLIAVELY